MEEKDSGRMVRRRKKYIMWMLFSAVFLWGLYFAEASGVRKARAQELWVSGACAWRGRPEAEKTVEQGLFRAVDVQSLSGQAEGEVRRQYEEYQNGFASIKYRADISACGFQMIEEQIFPVRMRQFGDVSVIPAFDERYNRLALFFAAKDGTIVYKTEELETNHCSRGELRQPTQGISAISLQDMDGDARMDIVLITVCEGADGAYKVGDVLFQDVWGTGFYRDYRISEKINRFGMNKSIELITAFVKDGASTEFLYTAATLDELLENGFRIIMEQYYPRNFEKLGRLQVVPGTFRIADYDVFMVYLVNAEGYIVANLQPMGHFDNLYALKGISCRDIDGDGLKDIIILARYSYATGENQLIVQTDYTVYYQRTAGFSADTQIKEWYPCSEEETMEGLVEKAREYWGWKSEQ